ncbi:MAG: nitrophenyl compound nitroreductase subunit ArsF family protein [Paludibacteraceae bacterium]
MKKLISLSVVMLFVLSFFSVNSLAADKKTKTAVSKTAKVEVYYFHYTRRCITCNAVENVTKEAIAEMYPAQFKKGLITFKSINLDEKENEAIAKKCQAEGQALLVVSNAQRVDLTDKGFMYARSKPEKLKEEIKNAIDPLL